MSCCDLFSDVHCPAFRGWLRLGGRRWQCVTEGQDHGQVSAATHRAALEHQHCDQATLPGDVDPNQAER